MIGDEELEQVVTMKYLGFMISGDGSMNREVKARIGCASRVIGGNGPGNLEEERTSHANECIEEDGESVLEGPNHKQ